MNIAISSTGPDPEDLVDPRFGRCRFYIFHNTATGTYAARENTASMH